MRTRGTKKPKRPNENQSRWLQRIAQSPLMVTFGEETRFSLQNGQTVPRPAAEVLIRNGWVKADGDALFFDRTQTYRALKP
jgi:hypothetical protein